MIPGTVLWDRFLVRGTLGQGGMATVYRVQDQLRGEEVALKVLHEHLTHDPVARARLVREAQAAARVHHAGILGAREVLEVDDRLVLTMAVHAGGSLAERVAVDGPLPARHVRRIAIGMADALAAAHLAGVVHRDVSPHNVLVTADGAAALSDLGLARLAEGSASATAGVVGTWGYCAPEIWDGARADARTDLYGLGAVLYLAATGEAAFPGDTPAGILKRQLGGRFTPILELRPGFPADLARWIEASIALDPSRRPTGAREVHSGLLGSVAPEEPVAMVPVPRALPVPYDVGDLPVGTYTVIVAERPSPRRRRLRREEGEITARDEAGPEFDLADAVARISGLARAPESLPASMRRHEFKMVEAVDHSTAEATYAAAISAGFQPRIVGDPNVRWSRSQGRELMLAVPLLMVGMMVAAVPGGALLSLRVLIGVLIGGAGLFALRRGSDRRTLHSVWGRSVPALDPRTRPAAPRIEAAAPPEDAVSRIERRTLARIAGLTGALMTRDDLPAALREELEQMVRTMGTRAARLARRWRELTPDPAPELASRQVAIEARLRASLDSVEVARLEAARDALAAAELERERALAHRTVLEARLIELGTEAARATASLTDDVDLMSSAADLLASLKAETEAAAAIVRELRPSGEG